MDPTKPAWIQVSRTFMFFNVLDQKYLLKGNNNLSDPQYFQWLPSALQINPKLLHIVLQGPSESDLQLLLQVQRSCAPGRVLLTLFWHIQPFRRLLSAHSPWYTFRSTERSPPLPSLTELSAITQSLHPLPWHSAHSTEKWSAHTHSWKAHMVVAGTHCLLWVHPEKIRSGWIRYFFYCVQPTMSITVLTHLCTILFIHMVTYICLCH